MKYYVFNDEVYIKAEELIDFASKENNNKIEIKGRVYQSPQYGHWAAHAVSIKGVPTEVCSVCGEWTYGDYARFCPNCGAKMIEADTEAMYYPQVKGITPTVIEVEEDGID